MRMRNNLFLYGLFSFFILIIGACSNQSENVERSNEKEFVTEIYLSPIDYDTIRTSINEKLICSNNKSEYIPEYEDITMCFEYSGKMKEYMKYGTMNVRPYDSSVIISKVNDTTFVFRVNKPYNDGVVSMYFEPTLYPPYHLPVMMYGKKEVIKPGEVIPAFMRSYLTKNE